VQEPDALPAHVQHEGLAAAAEELLAGLDDGAPTMADAASPTELSSAKLRSAVSPHVALLRSTGGSPPPFGACADLLVTALAAEDVAPDDTDALCASLLGTLMGLSAGRGAGVDAAPPVNRRPLQRPTEGDGKLSSQTEGPDPPFKLGAMEGDPEAFLGRGGALPSPPEDGELAPCLDVHVDLTTAQPVLGSASGLKAALAGDPRGTVAALLSWAEAAGVAPGDGDDDLGDGISGLADAFPGDASSVDTSAWEAFGALGIALDQQADPGERVPTADRAARRTTQDHAAPALDLGDALPPRRHPRRSSLSGSTTSLATSVSVAETDADIRMGGASARATQLKTILARARRRAEGYAASAAAAAATSAQTHARMQDIRRVMEGGAEAAFSLRPTDKLTADASNRSATTPPGPRSLLLASAPSALPRLRVHSVDFGRGAPPSPLGTSSVAGSQSWVDTAHEATMPLEQLLAGMGRPSDPAAAAEFAAQYGTAAAAARLASVKGLLTRFRADLEQARGHRLWTQPASTTPPSTRRASEGTPPLPVGKRQPELNRSALAANDSKRQR